MIEQKSKSMSNRINAWLEDIIKSIDEIYEFLPEKKDFFQYQKDLKLEKQLKGI